MVSLPRSARVPMEKLMYIPCEVCLLIEFLSLSLSVSRAIETTQIAMQAACIYTQTRRQLYFLCLTLSLSLPLEKVCFPLCLRYFITTEEERDSFGKTLFAKL